MKNGLLLLGCLFFLQNVHAHYLKRSSQTPLSCWHISSGDVEASFLMHHNDDIYLEHSNGLVSLHHLDEFGIQDRYKLSALIKNIEEINSHNLHSEPPISKSLPVLTLFLYVILLLSVMAFMIKIMKKNKWAYVVTSAFFFIVLVGFKINLLGPITTDPLFIDAAFAPHKHRVKTRWDDNWFYVESRGIPDHTMMTGITKWQQQVPLPQCYLGDNIWQIPLNPEIASNPIPVNTMHFLRGAIAIASNGIPIFNPYTNTGIDALKDGQLDIFGGHSGRADDYHYHIAPLHLQDSILNLPIAFSLDGFAVYGEKEPDGTPMKALDEFHGHIGNDGIYHYHGTKEAPYMIGIMKGKVTEDADLQLIPQPRAKGVRPSLTPLTGATIIDFKENSSGNGYILTYTRNGEVNTVDYSWTNAGKYTYIFSGPGGSVTEVYNGAPPCELSTAVSELEEWAQAICIFPNPASFLISIEYKDPLYLKGIKEVTLLDLSGKKVFTSNEAVSSLDVGKYSKGMYLLQIKYQDKVVGKKVILQ